MDKSDGPIADILYEDIFMNSPFGIYTLNSEGVITSFNPKMAELSGDRPENAIGLNALHLESYIDVGLDKLFKKAINGEAFETEVEYSSHLAKKLTIRHYRGIPIADRGITGQARLLLIVEDITDRRVMERSRDEFFSIASHELRTPLTAIRGNTSLIQAYLKDEIKNTEVHDIVDDIHNASVRLIDIVNDFLDMSRIEQGKIQYEKQAFDIYELCKKIVKELDVTSSRKKLVLEVKEPVSPIPLAFGDVERTRQIISNLLGNAIKFTKEGGITISFDKSGNKVEVSFSDTGDGISEESRTLLFRKFQQAQSNILTRDRSRGTGLGLYISRMMAHDMGGDVFLKKSKVGEGSVFCLTLPFATLTQTEAKIKSKKDES